MSGLDTQTHTHTQNDYRNPRCACAPRVNCGQCYEVSCAASEETLTRFFKRKLAPSVIGKVDSMKLLSHIFSTSIVQRRGLITFMDAIVECHVSPCPKFFSEEMASLVSSSYEGTFHIGDEEAASTILLVPFLVATVKQLQSITSRKFLVDGEFVVYKIMSRGRREVPLETYF